MIRKTIATPTGRISIVVRDGVRWREEALGVVCEQVLSQVLRRLQSRSQAAQAADGRRGRNGAA